MLKYPGVLLLSAVLVFTSCGKKAEDQNTEDNQISQATRYIDQGNYDSAIRLMEDFIQSRESARARMVLASAYAGRTGVKVETYWDLLVGFDAFTQKRKAIPVPDFMDFSQLTPYLDEESKHFLFIMNEQLKDLLRFRQRAEKVPHINPAQRHDLSRARAVIAGVTTAGSKLYRALLTVVIVKSDILRGEKLLRQWSAVDFNACSPLASEISKSLLQVLNLTSEALEDAGQAYPEENPHYQNLRKDLGKGIELLQTINSQQILVDALCELRK